MFFFQIFKCHKIILASCSEVFETMLFGSFKEANVNRDFEICISKTSPDVFDLAMRYQIVNLFLKTSLN